MNEKLGQVKEFVGKLSKRVKILIISGAAVLVIGAVVIALILNNRPYEVLFSGLGVEEAQQISQKLQEDGVEFKFQGDSTILVKSDVVDATKAKLVQEGYPKSGFTYDLYFDNASMMTTDSDKDTYKLYELQDRIGSTIRLFEGVKDAKVTIALAEQSKYVLSDGSDQKSTATATVTMEDGSSPSKEQALGIQRLVAKSVPNMDLSDVAVFDGNGNDVSVEADGAADSSDAEELAQIVENQIARKVMEVLGPIYGDENVRVSARAKINMEQLIRESTTYTTPEKIDEEDKTGIISKEEEYRDGTGTAAGASGVAGTETNADTAEYNTEGTGTGDGTYSESSSKEYLVNQVKEQGQVSPGVLDDLTVSVAINGRNFGSLQEAQLLALIGNASGIANADRRDKITVASAPFYQSEEEEEEAEEADSVTVKPLYLAAAIAAALILLAIIILVLIISRRRSKKAGEEDELNELQEALEAYAPVADVNKELQEVQNDKGMELKRNVREFADQNPEISAQLLKYWLNGGDANGEQ